MKNQLIKIFLIVFVLSLIVILIILNHKTTSNYNYLFTKNTILVSKENNFDFEEFYELSSIRKELYAVAYFEDTAPYFASLECNEDIQTPACQVVKFDIHSGIRTKIYTINPETSEEIVNFTNNKYLITKDSDSNIVIYFLSGLSFRRISEGKEEVILEWDEQTSSGAGNLCIDIFEIEGKIIFCKSLGKFDFLSTIFNEIYAYDIVSGSVNLVQSASSLKTKLIEGIYKVNEEIILIISHSNDQDKITKLDITNPTKVEDVGFIDAELAEIELSIDKKYLRQTTQEVNGQRAYTEVDLTSKSVTKSGFVGTYITDILRNTGFQYNDLINIITISY